MGLKTFLQMDFVTELCDVSENCDVAHTEIVFLHKTVE